MIKFSLFSQGESYFVTFSNTDTLQIVSFQAGYLRNIFTCRRINFHQQATKVSSAGNKSSKPMKLFVYREERVGWSERFHSLISSLIVSFTDMMRVVRQALLPAKA